MRKPHPNLMTELELQRGERILKALAKVPVNVDFTGKRTKYVLVAYKPDLERIGLLIRRARKFVAVHL